MNIRILYLKPYFSIIDLSRKKKHFPEDEEELFEKGNIKKGLTKLHHDILAFLNG